MKNHYRIVKVATDVQVKEVDDCSSKKEAKKLLKKYQKLFGKSYRVWIEQLVFVDGLLDEVIALEDK
jgi:hypothetical protein